MTSPTDLDGARVSWRKASRSTGNGADCVEVAPVADVIAVRDSKNPDGPKLAFDRNSWRRFASRIREGEHDL